MEGIDWAQKDEEDSKTKVGGCKGVQPAYIGGRWGTRERKVKEGRELRRAGRDVFVYATTAAGM
eukprot:71254-Chlamydomonas_euryale.AAC.5